MVVKMNLDDPVFLDIDQNYKVNITYGCKKCIVFSCL